MTLDEGWRRLHPISPVINSWQALVAVLALAVQQQGLGNNAFKVAGGLAVAVVVVTISYGVLAWRATRFRLLGPDLVLESGILFKRSRRVPLARLQAVDIVRPLLARALGLAELKLEVAGGRSSDATLAYLSEPAAASVRNELLALAAGLRDDVADVPAPDEAEETVVATTPVGLLVLSTLLSGPMLVVLALIAAAAVFAIASGEPAVFFGIAGSVLFGVGTQIWNVFNEDFGTTVAASADGLRVRRGLLETRAQTVPPGRVQGVVIREPAIWRLFSWVRVEVTVAGYGRSFGGGSSGVTRLLPIASRAVGYGVIARVLPAVDWSAVEVAPAPRRARWRAPIEAGRLAAGVGDEGGERVVVTRRGRFGHRSDIVPLARVQSVRLRQGPVQRALGLASVAVDVSPGPVRAVALHRDEKEARALHDRLVTEARAARAAALPDRWLLPGA
ncbi:MAG TPA: PH domain-containing protein [Acidimicrobiales bacterium]